jgi:hypothetical protein
MRLDPHHPALFLFYKGLAQFMQNRMEAATITLAQAAKQDPDEPLALLFLASAYGNLGQKKEGNEAISAFNRARVRLGGLPLVMVQITYPRPLFPSPPKGAPLVKGLDELGTPHNFDSSTFDNLRLTAPEVEALLFGHRIHGRALESGLEHGASVSPDGVAVKFGGWGSGAGTAKMEGNRLCFVWTITQSCGQILRNPGGTKEKENEYIWYLEDWGFTFSQQD